MAETKDGDNNGGMLSRRSFLKGVGVGSAATGLLVSVAEEAQAQGASSGPTPLGPGPVPITLRVNGRRHNLSVEPRVTLVNALRNHLDLTGTKLVCDRGSCGACSVEIDGKLVNSCMTLAIEADGKEITTIEGLADGDELHPVQEAFIEHDGLMCGFCTPGMIMACKSLLDRKSNPSLEDIKEGISGNLCRCGTYPHIFQAVQTAAKRMA